MRKLLLVAVAFVLAILVALPGATQAVSGNLVATAGIPVKLFGATDVKAGTGVVAVQGAALPDFMVHADKIHLERVRVTSSYVPVAPGLDATGERTVSVDGLDAPGQHLTLTSRLPDLLLVASGRDATMSSHRAAPAEVSTTQLWLDANAQLSALLLEETFAPPMPELRLAQSDQSRSDAIVLPAETYETTARDASAKVGHLDSVLFYGGVLRADDGTKYESALTRQTKAGSLLAAGAWTGPGTHVEETLEYYVVQPTNGLAEIESGSIALYSDDAFVAHHGFIGFPWAEGRVETENDTISLQGDQVVVGGDLRMRIVGVAVDEVPQLTLLGDGDIDYVKIGVAPAALEPVQAVAVAGAATAGVGLLAALVYFWPSVKYGMSVVLFPLYARVRKEETLEHKGRELLYELIKNEPGVSTNQLAKEVPFGWSTLTYHLRVLERNEAIVSVRDGRYKRFFDRHSGRYSNGRKFILAVLKNDATFGIANYIRQKPGASQKEVAENFHLSPSSVHWHVERLSEVGLVQKAREAHNVKYTPGEGWDHITVEDLKALAETPPAPVPAVAPPSAENAPPAPATL